MRSRAVTGGVVGEGQQVDGVGGNNPGFSRLSVVVVVREVPHGAIAVLNRREATSGVLGIGSRVRLGIVLAAEPVQRVVYIKL